MSDNQFYGSGKILPQDYNPKAGTIRQFIVDAVTLAGVIVIATVAIVFVGALI